MGIFLTVTFSFVGHFVSLFELYLVT